MADFVPDRVEDVDKNLEDAFSNLFKTSASGTRDQKVHGSNPDMPKAIFSRDMAGTCISFCFFQMILVRLASEEFIPQLH